MRQAFYVALALLSATQGAAFIGNGTATGAKLAVSQAGLVYLKDVFLPIILLTVETAKIPNPAASR